MILEFTNALLITSLVMIPVLSTSLYSVRNWLGVYVILVIMYCVFIAIPIITIPENEQSYALTENDNITCTATGYPVPDIVWLNNDGSEVKENRLMPGSVMTTDIGNIPSVSVSMIMRRNDSGNYTCLANNSVGNDTSTVHITVQCKFSMYSHKFTANLARCLNCVWLIPFIHIWTFYVLKHYS